MSIYCLKLQQYYSDTDQVRPYIDNLLRTDMSDYSDLFGSIQERQFEVVERQLVVMERCSSPLRLNLTTDRATLYAAIVFKD